jgi:Ca2+-transporting ATPase
VTAVRTQEEKVAMHWHEMSCEAVLETLKTSKQGLSAAEAARRLERHGPNELIERGVKSPWLIVWEQLTATMVLVLIIATAISAVLGDYKDAVAIMAIVVLNTLLGFSQEYRAEKAMAALKKLAVPTVRVRRGGHVQEISARDLVPGDIVLMEAGNLVPADGRLLECSNVRIQESALTGESEPVEKDPQVVAGADLPLGDRRNLVHMGTLVTYGRGLAVVTATGMATELGRIAAMIQTVDREPTPLQRRLEQLGRVLAVVALGLVSVIFALGLLRGEDITLLFLTAISMAVAAVPEGLPAVVTIALALGAQRMLKRRALIRKLAAVETLGSVTVICSDKTGTLTENRMTVTVLDVAGHRVDLTEHLHHAGPVLPPNGEFPSVPSDQPALALLLAGGALCNEAVLQSNGDGPDSFHAVGDPTEGALVVAAAQMGLSKAELEQAFPRVAEVPFDSERKRMTTVHRFPTAQGHIPPALERVRDWVRGTGGPPYVAFTKGAVDSLLDVSSQVWVDERAEPLTDDWRTRIAAAQERLAQNGMRVLGVAFRPLESLRFDGRGDGLERDLIFIGLVGMIDPPRPEVKDAVQLCKTAGIRPVMITGDHPLTAQHIARELGIAADGHILTGRDLARLSVVELEGVVEEVSVYARVSPEHKLKIVQALQNRGHIVAMTGDGVNDAPALKKADIGVAMGITGTDVAKEAADMVLQDDNFATIVAAVEEGRVIYDNIRKFIKFLMATNSAELWVMLLAPFLGMPLPLLPLQILWINLMTDGPPALALSVEPAERDTMRRAPYHPQESIFGRGVGRHIAWVGLLMGAISLAVGYWYWTTAHPDWQTMVFATLTFSQLANVLAVRSERDSLFRIGLLSNTPLLGAVTLTVVLQLAVVYVPFLQEVFTTRALSAEDLALSLALSTVVFWGVELEKVLIRRSAA